MEVALLSELEFKLGGGGGGMRALRYNGVQRTGSGMEGGEGGVQWRVGDGRASCLGEAAEKMIKGQRQGENLTLRSASEFPPASESCFPIADNIAPVPSAGYTHTI